MFCAYVSCSTSFLIKCVNLHRLLLGRYVRVQGERRDRDDAARGHAGEAQLKTLIEDHVAKTGSPKGAALLADWSKVGAAQALNPVDP